MWLIEVTFGSIAYVCDFSQSRISYIVCWHYVPYRGHITVTYVCDFSRSHNGCIRMWLISHVKSHKVSGKRHIDMSHIRSHESSVLIYSVLSGLYSWLSYLTSMCSTFCYRRLRTCVTTVIKKSILLNILELSCQLLYFRIFYPLQLLFWASCRITKVLGCCIDFSRPHPTAIVTTIIVIVNACICLDF